MAFAEGGIVRVAMEVKVVKARRIFFESSHNLSVRFSLWHPLGPSTATARICVGDRGASAPTQSLMHSISSLRTGYKKQERPHKKIFLETVETANCVWLTGVIHVAICARSCL